MQNTIQYKHREQANAANAAYRERIIATKRKLRERIQDLPQRFATINARVEAQIESIERERSQGIEPVPVVGFNDLERINDAQKNHIRQRGCVVIRKVFESAQITDWNAQLAEYLERNHYLEKLQKEKVEDHYFNTLTSSRPQIYGVFWSKPQMEARTDPAMQAAQIFLNRLWKFENMQGRIFDPDCNLLYADRVRMRQPGDASLGLSAHVDAGSIERWIDPAYHNKVFRHVFGGDIDRYDPFDAWGRTETEEIPSPAVCRAFRSFQAWTALTPQGPGDGTLQLLPVANAMAWVLLRALQDDVPEDELCGAAACRAMVIAREYHALLLRGYGSIVHMQPGDTVWWHPDVLHGVEDVPQGAGCSSVMYIAPAPDCQKNRTYAALQRTAFEKGLSAPDFASDNFEATFEGRFTKADLNSTGLRSMGYCEVCASP